MARRTIQVDYLARVEGEGGMTVRIADGRVEDVQLAIFEPPRFFEAFLRGRGCDEAADVTARICGICPVAYQMSAVHAVERALAAPDPGPTVRALRRLLYCGEWIESHVLHIYMLHAPDFLGYAGAVEMARDHKALVERGLRLKKVGNRLVETLAGRSVHPINVRLGGFYQQPTRAALRALDDELAWARDAARDTVRWVAALPTPALEVDYDFVALSHPHEYALNEGRVVSSWGLDIDAADFEAHFQEHHVAHSNALQALAVGRGPYLVGPLARFALNAATLPDEVLALAAEVGVAAPVRNPFRSIVVRALETYFAVVEA